MIKSLSRGSSIPVASATKLFVVTVNGWESIIVNTEISIFVVFLGVLDSPLYEIKKSRLN